MAGNAEARGASLVQERYHVIRELGSRPVPTFAAELRAPEGRSLVVLERIARAGIPDAQAAEAVREARISATLQHANLTRVRDVTVDANAIVVACDFIDGDLLSELVEEGATPTLDVSVRILLDALTGLAALHIFRGAKLAHGEVTAMNVLVGVDGIARVLRACRARFPGAPRGLDRSIAPEVLAGGAADARSDVYSIGVLLQAAVNRASADESWAAPLVDLCARAMSPAPAQRPQSAAAMSAEIRKLVGLKLATMGRVAAFVRTASGNKITVRRSLLEAGDDAPSMPPPAVESVRDISFEVAPVSSARIELTEIEPQIVAPPSPQQMRAPPPLPPRAAGMPSRTATIRPVNAALPPPESSGAILLDDVEPFSVRPAVSEHPRRPPAIPFVPPIGVQPLDIRPLAPPMHMPSPRPPVAAPRGALAAVPVASPRAAPMDDEAEPATVRRPGHEPPPAAIAVPQLAPSLPERPAASFEPPGAPLPAQRAMMATAPSIASVTAREKSGRRRTLVVVVAIGGALVAGFAVWRITQRDLDASVVSSLPPASATTPMPKPSATPSPPPAPPPVSAPASAIDSSEPPTPAASSAPAASTSSPPLVVAPPPATIAPPATTSVVAVPPPTIPPPPTTSTSVVVPPPPTATAKPPPTTTTPPPPPPTATAKPAPTFDPTRI